jgi:hypothetical protein
MLEKFMTVMIRRDPAEVANDSEFPSVCPRAVRQHPLRHEAIGPGPEDFCDTANCLGPYIVERSIGCLALPRGFMCGKAGSTA